MNIQDSFPSKYLAAAELNGEDKVMTIKEVGTQAFDNGTKPSLTFIESKKGLLLNKTNSNTIAKLYGNETDDWVGKRITLFPTQVDFQGEQVEAIRVRIRKPGPMPAIANAADLPPADAKSKAWTAFKISQSGESKENVAAAWKRAVQNYFGPSRAAEAITPAEWDKFRTDDFQLPPTDAQLSGDRQIDDDDIPF